MLGNVLFVRLIADGLWNCVVSHTKCMIEALLLFELIRLLLSQRLGNRRILVFAHVTHQFPKPVYHFCLFFQTSHCDLNVSSERSNCMFKNHVFGPRNGVDCRSLTCTCTALWSVNAAISVVVEIFLVYSFSDRYILSILDAPCAV